MREHNWSGFVCARCGQYAKDVELHHLKKLSFTGTNDHSNIIPLCKSCHKDWDYYDRKISFEHFLVTLPGNAVVHLYMGFIPEGLKVDTKVQLRVFSSALRTARMINGVGKNSDYADICALEVNQNDFFTAYPYSDSEWRKQQEDEVYGELPDNWSSGMEHKIMK